MRRLYIPVLLLAAASAAAAPLIAMRVETESLGAIGENTLVAVSVQVSPEDRDRVGDAVWLSAELRRGARQVERFEVSAEVDSEGAATIERQWPPGSYELRVDIESLSSGDTGFWKGRVRVPQMERPAVAPEPEAEAPPTEPEPPPVAVQPPPTPTQAAPATTESQVAGVAVPSSAPRTETPPAQVAQATPAAAVAVAPSGIVTPTSAATGFQPSGLGDAALTVIVSDGKNRPIKELRRSDFSLRVDGKDVTPTSFAGPATPLVVGFAVDRSSTMMVHMPGVRRALGRIAAQAVASGGGTFFVSLDGDAVNVHGSGSAPTKLDPALLRAGDGVEGSIAELVAEGLASFAHGSGRRALMVVSDGGDTATRGQWKETLDLVKTSGTPVFVVAFDAGDLHHRTLDRLRKAAYSSGGRVYILRDTELLKMTTDFYSDLLEASYGLGFTTTPGQTVKVGVKAGASMEVHHSPMVTAQ